MRKLKQSDIKEYREAMLNEQGGQCAFCHEDCVKPTLDHAHRDPHKDKVRGVICNSCNVLLGKCENSAVRLGVGMDGLRKFAWQIAFYATADYSDADWHPSKRKSEEREFGKLKAHDQVLALIPLGAFRKEDIPKNKIQRIALFKKLNNKL